jgi:hypothetical protein
MRRLLAILATLAAVTAAAPTASAVDTHWVKFNWCNVSYALQLQIHVCSAIEVRRQNDGTGLLVRRLTHYLDITGPDNPGDCDPDTVEQDPAVKNNYTWVDAENIDGGFITEKWSAQSPAGNIGGWNNCSMEWTSFNGGNITVNTQRLEGGYTYFLRINGLPDVDGSNTDDVFVDGSGSLAGECYVNDRCNRTVL